MGLDRSLDLFAHRFLRFSSVSFCFRYSSRAAGYVGQLSVNV